MRRYCELGCLLPKDAEVITTSKLRADPKKWLSPEVDAKMKAIAAKPGGSVIVSGDTLG